MISRNSLGSIYPIKKLGNIADFLDSRRKPVKECDRIIGPYPYYGANGLQGWINDFLFDENLILLAEDGGHFDNPDRGVAYKISGKTWVNNHAHVIKPKEGVDLDYLCRVLENYDLTPWITGTTRGKLTKGGASEILIPLPPLSEQRRIASILDQADELRQKRQQAIEKLDQLLQATFIDMFGDPASNPKGWNLGKLGDVIHSAKDGPHVSPNYSETGIPFLSTRHVRAGKIVWDDLKFITEEDAQIHWKKCKPTRGDILYTKGGTTGLAAVVDTDLDFAVWVHVALLKTNHDKVRSEWLVSMLNTQYCYEQSQRYTHGIANRDLGLKRMVNIEMYIPSLDEQDKFVNFKNKLMKNNLLFENSNSYFEQLFKSLQNQAFNGTL